jgi:hypothetical protein
LRNLASGQLLAAHHSAAVALLENAGLRPGQLRDHANRLLAAGATAGVLFLSPAQSLNTLAALPSSAQTAFSTPLDLQSSLAEQLRQVLPEQVTPLSPSQEAEISRLLHDHLGLHASAELEGNRLNRSYGYIGAEQHLPRYPGDNVGLHEDFIRAGITPGRGAWGYFAPSRSELTPQLVQTEKYYVAVQTLYLPDWSTRLAYLRDWYKYRKVVLVNPENGRVMVAAVADSGPSAWTGKHFGGSPEVMAYLQRVDGSQKGPVVLFFVDDPENNVPLGPLEYNLEKAIPLIPKT